MTADRFELLLSQRLILRDLDGFIDGRIRRIHGHRVADLLLELLSRRFDTVETALQGLRLQYPGYAEELERRFIRRTALRLEEREYTIMREDGLVGEELYSVLLQGISARRAEAEARPRLDIALKGPDLVRQFPLFADLDEDALKNSAGFYVQGTPMRVTSSCAKTAKSRACILLPLGRLSWKQQGKLGG